jgi:hypothetical protein
MATLIIFLSLLQSPPDDRAARISETVERIRGGKFATAVPLRDGTRKEYAQLTLANARLVYGEDLAAGERALKALGLIGRLISLEKTIGMFALQGPPAYNPKDGVAVLSADVSDDELVWRFAFALGDQRHGFPGVAKATGANFDAQMALSATRQGACDMTKHLWWAKKKGDDAMPKEHLAGCIAGAEKWEREQSRFATMVVPRLFVRASDFGWRRGGIFIEQVRQNGGMAAVDKVLAQPPVSTEQVLHVEKYVADERPVAIDVLPLDTLLATKGFTRVWRTTLGELGTAIVLETHIKDDVASASTGWGGDTLTFYENAEKQPLVAWATAWDTEADAKEFDAVCGRLATALSCESVRKGNAVLFFVGLPAAAKDEATKAAWKCGTRWGDRVSLLGE